MNRLVLFLSIVKRTLILLLVSLTFIGQGMAASLMSYQMIASKTQSMSTMSMSSHHGHMTSQQKQSMEMMSHHTATDDKCCSSDCQCLVSGCFNVFALSNMQTPSVILDITDKISQNTLMLPQQVMPPLFRPPIVS